MEGFVKFTKSMLTALSISAAVFAGTGSTAAAQQSDQILDKDWVCYYDRDTYELLYCQWE